MQEILSAWKQKTLNGKYFEMLGVFNAEDLVGMASLAERTEHSVSFGIEIFEAFRKSGYGYEALIGVMQIAKQRGYQLTVNQVRTDNFASMALCEKCALETDFYQYLNKKGNSVYLYVKAL